MKNGGWDPEDTTVPRNVHHLKGDTGIITLDEGRSERTGNRTSDPTVRTYFVMEYLET